MCSPLSLLCVGGLGCFCGCGDKRMPFPGSVATRLMYALGIFLATVLAWVLRNWGNTIIPSSWQACPGTCFQYLAPYRVSFGVVIYHAFFCLFTIGITTGIWYRARFHNGWWPVKLVMFVGLITAGFYVPESFLTPYGYICTVLGICFLIFQAIIMLDFAYGWAESWVERAETTDDPCWKLALVAVTGVSMCCVVAGSIIMYIFYTSGTGCGLNVFFITFNLVLAILMMIGSVLPRVQEANPRSGIMQASVLSAYLTYITLSALTSEPITADFSCASAEATSSFGVALFYIGFVLTFLALGLAAFSAGSISDPGLNQDADIDPDHPEKDEESGIRYRYWLYHLALVMAGGYIAVLLTNWSIISSTSGTGDFVIDKGFGSTWAKMGSSWALALFYLWTLIAPIVWPSRFGAV